MVAAGTAGVCGIGTRRSGQMHMVQGTCRGIRRLPLDQPSVIACVWLASERGTSEAMHKCAGIGWGVVTSAPAAIATDHTVV